MNKMTDEELGVELRAAYDSTNFNWWLAVARRARELLAAEQKPVATDEAIDQFLADGVGFGVLASPQNREYIGKFIRSALAHFVPPAPELPPISRMSEWQELADIMTKERADSGRTAFNVDQMVIVDYCARIAHRLSQPAPKPDPDAEAKRLAWAHESGSFEKNTMFTDANSLWTQISEANRSGWRAVAAAKAEGGG